MTDRQTDRQAGKQTDRQAGKQADRQRDRETQRETERDRERQRETERETERDRERQRETERAKHEQTDCQTGKTLKQKGKHIGRNLNGCARGESDEDQKGEGGRKLKGMREKPKWGDKQKEWRRRQGQLIGKNQKVRTKNKTGSNTKRAGKTQRDW